MTEQTPSKNQLRIFGLMIMALIALIIGLVLPKFIQWNASYYEWGAVLILSLTTMVIPKNLTPLYHVWIAFGDVLARINTFITLLLVWLILFIPIGIIMKICRYDPLKKSFDPTLKSYRIERQTPLDKASLERPF